MNEVNGVPYTYAPLIRTDNRPNRKFPTGKAEWITVHETGNFDDGATAKATRRWVHNGSSGQQLSFHDVVDDREIIQLLRDDEQGWHAGDGGGNGNVRSWGLEICVNLDGHARLKAIDNAARRVAWLLDHGHGVNGVVQHNHWSGKNCPWDIRRGHPITWQDFMVQVQGYRMGDGMNEQQVREVVRSEVAGHLVAIQNQIDRINEAVHKRNAVFAAAMTDAATEFRRGADPAHIPGEEE